LLHSLHPSSCTATRTVAEARQSDSTQTGTHVTKRIATFVWV